MSKYTGRIMAEVIAIASQKGGVGKTTTAVNLGSSLAFLGHRVLLIDMDPQGSVAASFGYSRYDIKAGVLDIFIADFPIQDAIHDTGQENYAFIPTNLWSDENEKRRLIGLANKAQLKTALGPVKDAYDFVLIDCPPSLGNLTFNALIAADSLLVPVQCEYYALKALGRFLKLTRIVKNENNPDLIYRGFLLTMVDTRNKLTNVVIEKIRYTLQGLVFETMIPRNIRLAEVPYHGKPVLRFDPGCKGAKSYIELAREILGDERAETEGGETPETDDVQVITEV
jgi:chromosome partitioning protein